jgi:hypothetical protein
MVILWQHFCQKSRKLLALQETMLPKNGQLNIAGPKLCKAQHL